MHSLNLVVHGNIPLFKCSYCGNCYGFLESTSYLKVKMRGCCWYFPKYKLIDIKNILNLGREDFIYEIANLSNSKIEKYHIEVLGYFDDEKYNKLKPQAEDFDSKLFFKLCPFFDKNGCKLHFTLRPHPCNLYLCREVIEACGLEYESYNRERKDYFAYCNYYNDLLAKELQNNNLNLIDNFDDSIKLLKQIHIPNFDFRRLREIKINFENEIAV